MITDFDSLFSQVEAHIIISTDHSNHNMPSHTDQGINMQIFATPQCLCFNYTYRLRKHSLLMYLEAKLVCECQPVNHYPVNSADSKIKYPNWYPHKVAKY